LPETKGDTKPHHQQGKVTIDYDGHHRPFGKPQQMLAMLALFEDAIFNHAAPVIGVKDREGIASTVPPVFGVRLSQQRTTTVLIGCQCSRVDGFFLRLRDFSIAIVTG
jgi:hypothetical protein